MIARLKKKQIPFLLTREPGGTAIGEAIRELLQFAPEGANMSAHAELLLFEASRAQLVCEVIRPALALGECVISDRYFDSTTVYQGAARKLDSEMVAQLNRFAVGDCIPDVTFVLDLDVTAARDRMRGPRRPDRMEQESDEFYQRVRDGYLQLAKREPKRLVLIDGSGSANAIESEIWKILSDRFSAFRENPKSTVGNL